MRIQIDRELCNGHAMCYRTSAELFVLDDDGFGFVRDGFEHVPSELEQAAQDSVLNCPEGAITIVDD